MSLILPNRPTPDEQRVVAEILENFDFLLDNINSFPLTFLQNAAVSTARLHADLEKKLGVGTNRRGSATASNELTRSSIGTTDVGCDVVLDFGSNLSNKMVFGVMKIENEQVVTGANLTWSLVGWDETDSVQFPTGISGQNGGPATYPYETDYLDFIADPRGILTTTGVHTFSIRMTNDNAGGTIKVRNRGLWATVVEI